MTYTIVTFRPYGDTLIARDQDARDVAKALGLPVATIDGRDAITMSRSEISEQINKLHKAGLDPTVSVWRNPSAPTV